MKSGYIVRTDYPEGNRMYQVYRLIDATKPDEPDNREEYAEYSGHDVAIRVAKSLNAQAAEYYWKGTE